MPALLALALLLAGCRGDSGSGTAAAPSSTPSTAVTSSSSTNPTISTTADSAVEIVSRYKQFW
ncbi:MAG: hypothetical protein ACR2KK_22355, partial [Acidimicrobiales bacterium]